MGRGRLPVPVRRRGRTRFGLVLLTLGVLAWNAGLAAGLSSAAPPVGVAPPDHRAVFGSDSRLVIWIVAQVHLMLGALVLGVPVFALIVEFAGWRRGDAL